MSDPVPPKLKPRPKRAEPLQPDAPWSGNETAGSSATRDENSVPSDAPATAADAADPALQRRRDEQQAEQREQALRNVREGYK